MQTITSVRNPQVQFWRSLKSRASRRGAGAFWVEGTKMAGEALALGDRVQALLVDQARQEAFIGLTGMAKCPVFAVTGPILEAVCDTKTPQGIAALVRLPQEPGLDGLGSLVVALDGVQDPGNVGTILRTADAAGFSGMLLSEPCADPYSPKCLRATMGSIFRLPALVLPSLPEALAKLRAGGYSILCGELDGVPFYGREGIGDRLCLVIGSEGSGVSPEVSALATHRLKLPMRGGAESLNAAVAAGIMMYDLVNRP